MPPNPDPDGTPQVKAINRAALVSALVVAAAAALVALALRRWLWPGML
jgi:hypothetical protein